MKSQDPKINDRKLRGEWAEMYFMACAAEHGLHVNRPYGEMSHFDFIIGDHGCLLRVQVKSTLAYRYHGYNCSVRGGHRAYVGDVFDFVAVLIIPERIWYIIPAELILGKPSIMLRPSSPNCKFAPYKEAWHLLHTRACALRGTISHIEGSAEFMPDANAPLHSQQGHSAYMPFCMCKSSRPSRNVNKWSDHFPRQPPASNITRLCDLQHKTLPNADDAGAEARCRSAPPLKLPQYFPQV